MQIVHTIKDRNKLNNIKEYLKHKNKRDYLILSISLELGIELKDYTKQQVIFYKDACSKGYIETKNKVRIYIDNELKQQIQEFIRDKTDSELMFPSRKGGKPLTRQQIYRIFNDATTNLGMDFTLNCTNLRKTFGYFYYIKNNDLDNLRKILEHKSIDETLRFIEVCNIDNK